MMVRMEGEQQIEDIPLAPPPPSVQKPSVASLMVEQVVHLQDTLSDAYTELMGVQVKQERVEQSVNRALDSSKAALYFIAGALFVIAGELGWIIARLH